MLKIILLFAGLFPLALAAQTTERIVISDLLDGTPIEVDAQLIKGSYFIEGDILVSPSSAQPLGGIVTQAVATNNPSLLWEDGIVYFDLATTHPNYAEIEAAIKFLNNDKELNICFKDKKKDKTARHITFAYYPKESCYASMGNGSDGSQLVVNIHAGCVGGAQAATYHELGHVLGLMHEHNAPNRDDHIHIEWDNIKKDKQTIAQYEKRDYTNSFSYGKYNIYDFNSIMHYPPKNAHAIDPTKPVFTCKPNCQGAGTATYFSHYDKEMINFLYRNVEKCKKNIHATLFLFDTSGSMADNNKHGQARQAAKKTLATIRQDAEQPGAPATEVGIMTFAGECSINTTGFISGGFFSEDLDAAEANMDRIPLPGGGTPLPQAINNAVAELQNYLEQIEQDCGTLVVMSDGESTCGPIRPDAVYAMGKHLGVQGKVCAPTSTGKPMIRHFTIGFDIQPGSAAERDLQYLAYSTGGKYFHAQDEYQLTRALQKINRIYVPIFLPQQRQLSDELHEWFQTGVSFIYSQQYDTALVLFRKFIKNAPLDSAGLYNLAMMCEANERYKSAANNYELYLQQAVGDPRRRLIQERIVTLRKDYEIFKAYMKKYLQSDLAYLQSHFAQLQSTPDAVPLAGEFAGFIQERYLFYKLLPDILEMEEPWLKQYSKEISQSLREADFYLRKKPEAWSDEGVYRIGLVHEPMRRLVKQLGG